MTPEDTSRMTDEELLAALERDEAYEVVRELAHGPTGATELVRRRATPNADADADGGVGSVDASDGRLLVRKRIPAAIANRRAWEAARRCDEPLLVRVRDVYELPDQLVVVYDYVPGESLSALVVDAQGLDPASACVVAIDVCRAAGALHEVGVVHRDITPSNVIVSVDGAHLVDLGIARLERPSADAVGAHASHDTTTLGTVGFAAPEQFGFARTDVRSDVYAIGRLVAWMVGGEFESDGSADAAMARLDRESPALAAVVRKACSFDRDARYDSVAALARALREAMPAVAAAGEADAAATAARRDRRPRASGALRGLGFVVPADLLGALREAGMARVLVALAVALALGVAGSIRLLDVAVGDVMRVDDVAGRLYAAAIAVAFGISWLYATLLEVPGAILRAGPYRGEGRPARRALRRCVAAFLVSFAVYVVLRTIQLTVWS